ncbi:PaRep2b protein [Pyrobaculum oguniense TE7]|uniref:PaRep2b protein n=1 Tax=Pyrobaculum oguniense (strain DSM 13380 / JCM 10595 / TE7) TaxID=698757 RepID=H6QDE0_PYROT|nr:PaRep2b protein [Pyrobaculum oguniense TE7]
MHFTAKKPEKDERAYIHLKLWAGLWKLEELARQGVGRAERAVRRLEEIVKARGFYDPRGGVFEASWGGGNSKSKGMVVEDPERGIKAVVKDVWVQWEECGKTAGRG